MTIKDIIISLFGTYTPITYSDGVNDIIPSGAAGVDYAWIAGVLLFSVTLYCVLRIVGGLLSNAFRN